MRRAMPYPCSGPEHVEGLQDHQGQRSLLDILFLFHAASSRMTVIWFTNRRMPQLYWESNRCVHECGNNPLAWTVLGSILSEERSNV